ncbi:MAG: hypothetical protein IKK39_08770 [Thermoguttaceae bacterium]|nr:hypothetical protein [Thermoguttaceae bacterium]
MKRLFWTLALAATLAGCAATGTGTARRDEPFEASRDSAVDCEARVVYRPKAEDVAIVVGVSYRTND